MRDQLGAVELAFDWLLVGAFVASAALLLWGGGSRRLRVAAAVLFWTLALTPVMAPATIVSIPFPFGFLLGVSAVRLDPDGLSALLAQWPRWNLAAFVSVGVAGFVVANKVTHEFSIRSPEFAEEAESAARKNADL